MSRGREYTIRQAQRKKKEAAKQMRSNDWPISEKSVGIHANTPTRCSCDMCGNPRKYQGDKTLQEQTNEINYRQSMHDVAVGLCSTDTEYLESAVG